MTVSQVSRDIERATDAVRRRPTSVKRKIPLPVLQPWILQPRAECCEEDFILVHPQCIAMNRSSALFATIPKSTNAPPPRAASSFDGQAHHVRQLRYDGTAAPVKLSMRQHPLHPPLHPFSRKAERVNAETKDYHFECRSPCHKLVLGADDCSPPVLSRESTDEPSCFLAAPSAPIPSVLLMPEL